MATPMPTAIDDGTFIRFDDIYKSFGDKQVLQGISLEVRRRGERVFNSPRYTLQGQFSCRSCHPDTDTDGLISGVGVSNGTGGRAGSDDRQHRDGDTQPPPRRDFPANQVRRCGSREKRLQRQPRVR